ncbi:hypothetical protein ACQKWADRAFT_299677 [Trichoderma austrokoningii]
MRLKGSDYVSLLSEENLKKHNRQITNMTSDASQTTESAISSSAYRFIHLANARVCLNARIPPDTKIAIDGIVERKQTQERIEQLKLLAKDVHNQSNQRVCASDGEGDFLGLLIPILDNIKSDTVCYHHKADWEENLKPLPPQFNLNLDLLADPPAERHQSSSISTASTESDGDGSFIKTPRPDISIGIYKPKLISRLVSADVSGELAGQLLFSLQEQSKHTLPDGSSEPMLISVPASRASDLAFPFAVVEGKAHSTGKSIFEAQNQAAVAGACALKIQLDLEDIVRRAERIARKPPTFSQPPPLLFFSVCTEGPIHELWAHFVVEQENGSRTFASSILMICHTGLLDTVEKFIVALDNVCHWGMGPFLEYVVERLELVASSVLTK